MRWRATTTRTAGQRGRREWTAAGGAAAAAARPARAAPPRGRPPAGALRAAARLARADLFSRPGQTALTAVAIFAAATALVVTLALRAGLDDPFADAMTATRGAHVALYGEFSDADVAALTALPGVTASDVRARENTRATLGGRVTEVGLEALPAADAADRSPARHRRAAPGRRGRGARRAQLRARGRAPRG